MEGKITCADELLLVVNVLKQMSFDVLQSTGGGASQKEFGNDGGATPGRHASASAASSADENGRR